MEKGVKESFIYGLNDKDNDPVISVKIVYDREIMNEVYNADNEEKIKDVLWKKVKEINKTMPPYKYIRKLTITEEELIKTTTQKIKRFEEIKKIEETEKNDVEKA